MRYIAIHYVKIAGRMFTPGEIFEANIPPEKEERLIAKGAIRLDEAKQSAPVSAPPAEPETPEEPQESGGGEADDGFTEADEDAPEIDVMDGLVPDTAAEEAPKPAPKPKPKAAPKKTAAKGRTKK